MELERIKEGAREDKGGRIKEVGEDKRGRGRDGGRDGGGEGGSVSEISRIYVLILLVLVLVQD